MFNKPRNNLLVGLLGNNVLEIFRLLSSVDLVIRSQFPYVFVKFCSLDEICSTALVS